MLDSIQVIIPALDEEATIGGVVTGLRRVGLTRIRVVDNGSRDGTALAARAAGAEVVGESRRGYGQACWTGAECLPGDVGWLLFADADGSDDPDDVARLVAAAEAGAELVLGDRRARPEAAVVMTPVQRFGNALATSLIRIGWGGRYHDLGPLRLIRRDLYDRLAMRDRGFGWTIEMQVRAIEEGARVVELPVAYRRRAGGRSKISGSVRGSVAAGTIILGTLARLGWRRFEASAWGYRLAGLLVLAGAALMAPWGDFARVGTVPWFLAAAGVMAVGWLLALHRSQTGAKWFWIVAVGARLLLLPMTPGDDVWRYLWEGQVMGLGLSPYAQAPADVVVPEAWEALRARVNHPDVSAIYPPLAQFLLGLVAVVSPTVWALKAVFVAADLAVVALLARRFGPAAARWYAWNPLVIYVGAGGAHYEPVLMLAMVAGWMAWLSRAGRAWTAVGLGVAMGLKWITAPLLAWLVWDRVRSRRWREAGAMMMAGVAPLALALVVWWVVFGSVGPLWPATFVREARTAEWGPWVLQWIWPGSAYRNEVVAVLFAPVALWVLLRSRALTDFAETFLVVLLVCAPSVHAWYFVWLVPWSVVTRNVGTAAVSLSGFMYFWLWHAQATNGEWTLTIGQRVLLWGPLLVGFGYSRIRASQTGAAALEGGRP